MDAQIVEFFQSFQNTFLDIFLYFFTIFGGFLGVILLFIAFLVFANKKFAIFFGACYGLNVFINFLLKLAFNRDRPFVDNPQITNVLDAFGKSFPSGHSVAIITMAVFFIYFAMRFVKNKSIRVLLYVISCVFVVFVGISRIYFGQHYLTDVIAGLVLGFALSFCEIKFLFKKFCE